jgi:YidC/Oxa1 family membrane protein insertase
MDKFLDKILGPFLRPTASLLNALYGFTNSYAIAIAILTLLMMVVLLPLTLKSTKSMLEMQKVQLLMKQIQQEYKNDIQGRNAATMALYKEHKINPAGGCLPMLLQTPFFMTMWRVLYGLTSHCGEHGNVACTPGEAKSFLPRYLSESSKLYQSLIGKTEMRSFGLDLSKPALKVISTNIRDEFWRGIPYLALVIVVGLLSYYQQRQLTARSSSSGTAVNPQQQMIMNLMPIMFGVFSLTFPSGLIIYFLVQNLFRIGQNAYITKRFYGDDSSAVIETTVSPKPAPASVSSKPSRPKPTGSAITATASKPKPKPASSGPAGRPTPPVKPNAPRPNRPTPKKK